MQFFDNFAGIGGFRVALERLGHECVGSAEIDKDARKIYAKNFGREPEFADITKVDARDIPDHDILCSGFPCQAFSLAGKRLGFEDTRGSLFFEIARIARQKRPRLLFLENVKGLLSHDNGRTFGTILNTLDELGYIPEWQVLNGRYFLPQNRERVFIVGHLRGEPWKQVFPLGKGDQESAETQRTTERNGEWMGSKIASTLDANYSKGGRGGRTMIVESVAWRSRGWEQRTDGVSHALRTREHFVVHLQNGNMQGRRFKNVGEPAFTLIGSERQGVSDGQNIRRLTPLECERLQGFPEGWTEGVSDTARYRLVGNAVMPPVIEYIAKHF